MNGGIPGTQGRSVLANSARWEAVGLRPSGRGAHVTLTHLSPTFRVVESVNRTRSATR